MKTFFRFLGRFIGWVFRLTALALLVAVLTPIVYFAWRAGQPMEMPEFKGLTYYEYLAWQQMAYEELEKKYDADSRTGEGCYAIDVAVPVGFGMPNLLIRHIVYLIYPDQTRALFARDVKKGILQTDVTWMTLLPELWSGFEHLEWLSLEGRVHSPIPACRIHVSDLPTPEELRSLRLNASAP